MTSLVGEIKAPVLCSSEKVLGPTKKDQNFKSLQSFFSFFLFSRSPKNKTKGKSVNLILNFGPGLWVFFFSFFFSLFDRVKDATCYDWDSQQQVLLRGSKTKCGRLKNMFLWLDFDHYNKVIYYSFASIKLLLRRVLICHILSSTWADFSKVAENATAQLFS